MNLKSQKINTKSHHRWFISLNINLTFQTITKYHNMIISSPHTTLFFPHIASFPLTRTQTPAVPSLPSSPCHALLLLFPLPLLILLGPAQLLGGVAKQGRSFGSFCAVCGKDHRTLSLSNKLRGRCVVLFRTILKKGCWCWSTLFGEFQTTVPHIPE